MEVGYKEYLELLSKIKESGKKPKILLHACCAPCSSEVLEELKDYFDITIYYYNPNIYPFSEYQKRNEQFLKLPHCFNYIEGKYEKEKFDEAIKGFENAGELSIRCYKCMQFRMKDTAIKAKENGFDYFTTTLSISPYKKSDWINEIGKELEREIDIPFLYSNFKKKEGYKKSIALSIKYNLYRQHYCGCIYSLNEAKNNQRKEA